MMSNGELHGDMYLKIQSAKALLGIDETNEKYYTFFFLALRQVGVPIKEAVKIIHNELKETKGEINYHYIYSDITTFIHIFSESGNSQVMLPSEKEIEKTGQETLPKNNLGNMVWIETITRAPKTGEEFLRSLKKVRGEIVNPNGG